MFQSCNQMRRMWSLLSCPAGFLAIILPQFVFFNLLFSAFLKIIILLVFCKYVCVVYVMLKTKTKKPKNHVLYFHVAFLCYILVLYFSACGILYYIFVLCFLSVEFLWYISVLYFSACGIFVLYFSCCIFMRMKCSCYIFCFVFFCAVFYCCIKILHSMRQIIMPYIWHNYGQTLKRKVFSELII